MTQASIVDEKTTVAHSTLLRELEKARDKLIDTGMRNRLVHVKRQNKRALAINVVNERSDDVFRILWAEAQTMKFKALGKDATTGGAGDDGSDYVDEITRALAKISDEDEREARFTDDKLETLLGPAAQQKRLLRLARDARTAEEEQGINVLYLALGFLRWFEDTNSDVMREAPLILLPVRLVRNKKSSTYDLERLDDDIETNLSLKKKLETDFGLQLPDIEDADSEGWSPGAYFERVEKAISARDRWSVDGDGIQLGFFSFATQLLMDDLNEQNWPGDALLQSPILSTLLLSGTFEGDSDRPHFGDSDNLDEKLDLSDIFHVVDADRSQAIVIEEVRKGRNLVVQGPPGTGKSQTITNIIAAAVHDGKKVLFIAEKMAALSVVHDRLKKAGLSSVALELHSKAANKRRVLDELVKTLDESLSVPDAKSDLDSIRIPRDRLNENVTLLHGRVEGCALSPFDAMAIMSVMKGKGAPPPEIDGQPFIAMPDGELDTICEEINELGALLAEDHTSRENPWRGVNNLELQPLDLERAGDGARQISILAGDIVDDTQEFREALEISAVSLAGVDRICRCLTQLVKADQYRQDLISALFEASATPAFDAALNHALAWSEARKTMPFLKAAFVAQADKMRQDLARGVGSFFQRSMPRYRKAKNLLATLIRTDLPGGAKECLELADRLVDLQELKAQYGQGAKRLEAVLGPFWADEATDFALMRACADFIREFRQLAPDAPENALAMLAGRTKDNAQRADTIKACMQEFQTLFKKVVANLEFDICADFGVDEIEQAELTEVQARFAKMAGERGRYDKWRRYCKLRQNITEYGIDALGKKLEQGLDAGAHGFDAQNAIDELRHARAEAAWHMLRKAKPGLDEIIDTPRHDLVKRFQDAEKTQMKFVQKNMASTHLEAVSRINSPEIKYIRSQSRLKRGHHSIRKIFTKAGSVVQEIRPVFLMSPISVAQFLPTAAAKFDLLVIDEASQVKPEYAFGAIARADQIVVIGDQKQLPPTAFFDSMTGNEDDGDEEEKPLEGYASESESILSLCDSRQLPSRMLSWHYRSRDPSLIRVSNVEFYGGHLVLPPSPLEKDPQYGLRFIESGGTYTPGSGGEGRPRTNITEAKKLVEAVKTHACRDPALSLGIATFNIAQADCLNELLEIERRSDSILDDFLGQAGPEPVFVKNIENIQGDERDVIMISVGFGPSSSGGRLRQNFGPVNKEGGERRLNVLFSRARLRCDVFCSFAPGDIVSEGKPEGVRILKRYLHFANTGVIDEARPTGGEPDSPFESDVGTVIRDLGYGVDYQVGSAGFRIDLGVLHPGHPGQYMLAVECDGRSYHSSLWSRERDRLRQDILENLGWHFHRIWSTDWFQRRDKEIKRLRSALECTARQSNPGSSMDGANTQAMRAQDGAREDTKAPASLLPARETIPDQPSAITTPYRRAEIDAQTDAEPHEAEIGLVNRLVAQIVLAEGPVHQDEIARRYAGAFGKQRAGRRIMKTVIGALQRQKGKPIREEQPESLLLCEDRFWMTEGQKNVPPLRNRADFPGIGLTKPEMLPPVEISRLAELIVDERGVVSLPDIIRQIARELGFERTGPKLEVVIRKAAQPFARH